jgi:hypothetical protein
VEAIRDPISKKSITKRGAEGVAQGVGPEFNPSFCDGFF